MGEEKKHTYQSTTLGLPPLRMVLVHARNEAQNASMRAIQPHAEPDPAEEPPFDKEQAVRKIIQHLQSSGQ